jgi:hypothetical protein
MIGRIRKIIEDIQINSIKFYLILTNIILVIFGIWFSNVGLLPFSNTGDFLFFAFLGLLLAIYRPGWTFVLFIGALALENINLAPKTFGLALRPYQFLGAITAVALLVQIVTKRIPFSLPKWKWYDALAILFALGSFLSVFSAINRAVSLKQAVVALSFVVLYFVTRVYVQSFEDLKRIMPFFLSSAGVVVLYGILQNIIFIHGGNSFEIMPGRSNATFAEPDWLGIYLVFLLAAMFMVIYYQNNKTRVFDFQFSISRQFSILQFLNYTFLALIFIALILTVSRSSWLGAILVTIGFLKIMLTNGTLQISAWDWKKFFRALQNIVLTLVCSIAIIYLFGLTRFQIFNRAASTGGLQKITIACGQDHPAVPQMIENISELQQYGCRHINLEDIEKEKSAGNAILETSRPDPNVNIRAGIYQKSVAQIKQHPIFGIGWGSVSAILGTDERGAGLNASDIFLEVWLGAGLIGILSFVILLGYIFIKSIIMYLDRNTDNKTAAVFILLGWAAIVIPNLFNSGIFLGFIWAYLAIAISLVEAKG